MDLKTIKRVVSSSLQKKKRLNVLIFCPVLFEEVVKSLANAYRLRFTGRMRLIAQLNRKFGFPYSKGEKEVRIAVSFNLSLPQRESDLTFTVHSTQFYLDKSKLKALSGKEFLLAYPNSFSFHCKGKYSNCQKLESALGVLWEDGSLHGCYKNCYGAWELFLGRTWWHYYREGEKVTFNARPFFSLSVGEKSFPFSLASKVYRNLLRNKSPLEIKSTIGDSVLLIPIRNNATLLIEEESSRIEVATCEQAAFTVEGIFYSQKRVKITKVSRDKILNWLEVKNVNLDGDGLSFVRHVVGN